jgi:hypothetical protein
LKSLFSISFFLFIASCFSQQVSMINKELELNDSLVYSREIRVYKFLNLTEKAEVFQMFDKGYNDWEVYIYSFSKTLNQITKIDNFKFPKATNGSLKAKEPHLIWLNILLCNVDYLPSMDKIDYKLSNKRIESGELVMERSKILDGCSYEVFFRNNKIRNHFSFSNAEAYLEQYPDVDELILYNKLLLVLKNEFSF